MGKQDRGLVIGRCLMGAVICSFGLVHAARLPVRVYTTADGLPRNRISVVLADSRGFVWAGTPDGLARFDGEKFVTYGVSDGFRESSIVALIESRDGTLWAGTSRGVYRFTTGERADRAAPSFEAIDPTLSQSISCVLEDRNGGIWYGTDLGLFRLEHDGSTWRVAAVELGLRQEGHYEHEVRDLLEDRSGAIWASTGSGLFRLAEKTVERFGTEEGFAAPNGFGALAEDSNGRVWVVTNRLELLVQEPRPGTRAVDRTFRAADYGIPDGLFSIHRNRDGGLWLAAGLEGLWSVTADVAPGRWRTRRHDLLHGTQTEVQAFAEDAEGNLWIGTSHLGLLRLDKGGFETFDASDGIAVPCTGLFEARAGQLCAASRRAISCFDGHRFHAVSLNLPSRIRYMGWSWNQVAFQDHVGEVWVPTGQGLCRFRSLSRNAPIACYTKRDGLPSEDVFRLYEDRRGDVWVGVTEIRGTGLARWDRATNTLHAYDEVADGGAPTAFAEDDTGGLWIGFWNGGIMRYANGSFSRFLDEVGGHAQRVYAILIDHAGRLWAATARGGLYRCEHPLGPNPQFQRLTMKDGLSTDAVLDLAEDFDGDIWVYTTHGVDRLDPRTGRLRHYGSADGLPVGDGGVLTVDRTGTLWASTGTAVSRLITREETTIPPGSPRILALLAGGDRVPLSSLGQVNVVGIELQSDRRGLEIEYASMGSREPPLYQYRLEGVEADFSKPAAARTVVYPYLPPGRYRFAVRAVGSEGTVTGDATVSFRIRPPIWWQGWFLGLGVSLLLLGAFVFQRQRVRRLVDLERVRTRIATDLHDDIGSSLSRVAILTEVVRRRVEPDSPESSALLGQVATSARALVDSMSDIVWALDPRRDDLGQVIARIREFASELLDPAGIAWSFAVPAEPGKISLPAEQRRHLYLVFKEALHNVFKHSGATSVVMSIERVEGRLKAEIRDDGCGFAHHGTPRVTGGNGFRNMRARAEQAGGELAVESKAGVGTRIVLNLPLA